MNLTNDKEVMIFRSEYEGKVFYSLGLSKKNQDGSYTNGYIPCQFKNGVNLANQTKIKINKAFLTFYINQKTKETKPHIMILDFTVSDNTTKNKDIDLYATFGSTVKAEDVDNIPINGMELPF